MGKGEEHEGVLGEGRGLMEGGRLGEAGGGWVKVGRVDITY